MSTPIIFIGLIIIMLMHMGKHIFYTLAMLFVGQVAVAQPVLKDKNDGDDDPYEKQSYFMYGLNYLSNNVYLGRKDSVAVPYYTPYIGYHFKSGLYAKGMLSFTPTDGTHLDLATLEAGYDHSFGNHFNAGLSVDKFYYNKNSLSVRANTKGSAGVNGQYTNDWIEPQVNVDANINKNSTDYITNLVLDHDFAFAKNKIHIIPNIGINIGTQHYYDEYFINRLTKKDKTLKIKKVVADPGRYKARDYEFSVKSAYIVSKWLFTLIPTYAIPVNPATVTLPKQTVTEKLSNTFFVELDICHR